MSTAVARRRHLHPFPARMAPDVALDKIEALTEPGEIVLDPMCGSGTVPNLAIDEDREAIGCDIDPLAVLITRTACNPQWSDDLAQRAKDLVEEARDLDDSPAEWLAGDPDSTKFTEFWFAKTQRDDLTRLARTLAARPKRDDALRVALSRIIITKEGGASLARDTAHSRPHKVREENDFDVFDGFIASSGRLERLAQDRSPARRAKVRTVDARNLGFVEAGTVDLAITSPPYLNAIDYLRGHRMSLVWLGWTTPALRQLRAESIGSERGLDLSDGEVQRLLEQSVPRLSELSNRDQRMAYRFTKDIGRLCGSLARVVRQDGHLVFVVADSQLRGVPVSNSMICKLAAQHHAFEFVEGVVRPLPAKHRYLPPPREEAGSLDARMREEAVLTFKRV